ncbi:hypothetical protein H0H92_001947 [Tricholoma furcatifolium]|nr:hypothetical protein H0H92_001947 [Tricholoma furcatifolium]
MYISLVDADLPEECTEETVDTLFRIGEPDPARIALFTAAFDPPPIDGTEEALHSFWDHNIRKIIELLIPSESGKSPRNNKFNQLHTQTKKLHPDFGFLIKEVCLFRGEEKGMDCPGDPTRAELVDKLNWAYDPSPYILVSNP